MITSPLLCVFPVASDDSSFRAGMHDPSDLLISRPDLPPPYRIILEVDEELTMPSFINMEQHRNVTQEFNDIIQSGHTNTHQRHSDSK